ncbi:MAG: hypothetical protein NC124_12860 [Clostridium sp.]|nr:hypothetical protein [Clostridium sp.]
MYIENSRKEKNVAVKQNGLANHAVFSGAANSKTKQLSRDCYDDVRVQCKQGGVRQSVSAVYDKHVLQLRKDTVALSAGKQGTKPVMQIGLTCHHVIPAHMLETFYNFCARHTNEKIKADLKDWEEAAVDSANATAQYRTGYIPETKYIDSTDADYADEAASASQWMSGNIFIGPGTDFRIDDLHGESNFDFGGYLLDDSESQCERRDVASVNRRMDKLKELYDKIKNVLAADEGARDVDECVDILKELAKVASGHDTLHKGSDPKAPAYNVNDWISVGGKQVDSMQDKMGQFVAMYGGYLYYTAQAPQTRVQAAYMRAFETYINMHQCKKWFGEDGKRSNTEYVVIARRTFEILSQKWELSVH